MTTQKDRMDVHGVTWYESTARAGEECRECRKKMRRGSRVLVERVLFGTAFVLHRKCWKEHLRTTEREARKLRREKKALDSATSQA